MSRWIKTSVGTGKLQKILPGCRAMSWFNHFGKQFCTLLYSLTFSYSTTQKFRFKAEEFSRVCTSMRAQGWYGSIVHNSKQKEKINPRKAQKFV